MHLVARTPPAWADAGQRISLALWDGSALGRARHPHPHPDRRFRLDLHRHLWDARRAGELRARAGADRLPTDAAAAGRCRRTDWPACAVGPVGGRGGAPAARRGAAGGAVTVGSAAGAGWSWTWPRTGTAGPPVRVRAAGAARRLPVLPDAATWVLPDLELLRPG